jgi:hypothetical protein
MPDTVPDLVIAEFTSMALITQITLTVKPFGLETSLSHEVGELFD